MIKAWQDYRSKWVDSITGWCSHCNEQRFLEVYQDPSGGHETVCGHCGRTVSYSICFPKEG